MGRGSEIPHSRGVSQTPCYPQPRSTAVTFKVPPPHLLCLMEATWEYKEAVDTLPELALVTIARELAADQHSHQAQWLQGIFPPNMVLIFQHKLGTRMMLSSRTRPHHLFLFPSPARGCSWVDYFASSVKLWSGSAHGTAARKNSRKWVQFQFCTHCSSNRGNSPPSKKGKLQSLMQSARI